MPEGKTVEFEFGTMPYDHHGKPMSFLDVAENFGIFLDHPACGGGLRLHDLHLWIKDQEGISPADDDELDRMDMAADQQLNSRLGCQAVIASRATTLSRFPSGIATLHVRGQTAGHGRRQVAAQILAHPHWGGLALFPFYQY